MSGAGEAGALGPGVRCSRPFCLCPALARPLVPRPLNSPALDLPQDTPPAPSPCQMQPPRGLAMSPTGLKPLALKLGTQMGQRAPSRARARPVHPSRQGAWVETGMEPGQSPLGEESERLCVCSRGFCSRGTGDRSRWPKGLQSGHTPPTGSRAEHLGEGARCPQRLPGATRARVGHGPGPMGPPCRLSSLSEAPGPLAQGG